MTIPLIDRIVPKTPGFPVYNSQDGYGSWQTRIDAADRNSIPQLNRYGGMIVKLISDGYYYELSQNLQDWTQASFSGINTVASNLNIVGQTQGSLLYFNGSTWVQLSPSIDGYVLTTHSVGQNPTWSPTIQTSLSNSSPVNVNKSGASVGVSSLAARSDHKHDIDTAPAISSGGANTEGTATTLARSDHTHATIALNISGQAQGDILYFNGTNWVRLAAAIDGYVLTTHSTGQNPTWTGKTPLGTSQPIDVDKSSAIAGVSGFAAREDHKHNILTAPAISSGAANTEGTATTLARSDHTHATTALSIAGQTQGDVLYFNGTNWVKLAASTDGYYLTTHNSGANPTWTKATIAGTDLTIAGQVQGSTLYFNGSNWVQLVPGIDGQSLITHGTANPTWSTDFKAQNLITTGSLSVGAPVTIKATAVSPTLLQATDSTSVSTTGQTLSITAQNMTGLNTLGGGLTIGSGIGTAVGINASDGYVQIKRGANVVARWLTGTVNPLNFNSVASDDYISFGLNPAAFGTIKLNATSIIAGRNVANTGDRSLLTWLNDILTVGNLTNNTIINGSVLNVTAASQAIFTVNSISCMILTGSGNTIVYNNLLMNGFTPAIKPQDDFSTVSSLGIPLIVNGQNNTGFNSRGGDMILASGQGATATAPDGYLYLKRGTQIVGNWKTGLSSDDFIALNRTPATTGNIRLSNNDSIKFRNAANSSDISALSLSSINNMTVGDSTVPTIINGSNLSLGGIPSSYNSMVGGIFIINSSVIPTGNPVNGVYEYATGGSLVVRGSSGTITVIANP